MELYIKYVKAVLICNTHNKLNLIDLQVATIHAKIADLTTKNTTVATAYTNISNSRIARNQTLYTSTTSLYETALEVKKYIKSVFGATSPQYAQVKSIEFSKPRL